MTIVINAYTIQYLTPTLKKMYLTLIYLTMHPFSFFTDASMNEPKKKMYNIMLNIWNMALFHYQHSTLPMCLLCNKTSSNESMKPSKLKKHLTKVHSDKKAKDLSYFKTVKQKYLKTPPSQQLFTTSEWDDDGLHTSYNISLLIAKSRKHTPLVKNLFCRL